MDFRAIVLFLMVAVFLAFWLLVLSKGPRQILTRIYSIFIANMALWSFGLGMFYVSQDPKVSLFWADFLYLEGSLIAAAFLHFSFVFPLGKIAISYFKQILIYVPNIILFYLLFFTPVIIKDITPQGTVKGFVYGPGHIIWDLQFDIVFAWAFVRFFKAYTKSDGIVKMRLRYVILGTLTGVILAGITNVVMPWFNRFELLWLAPTLTLTWLFAITYAILKYRLMDINLALTRAGIFVIVYALVLGIPFWLGAKTGKWLYSTLMITVLATVGPFIYTYIRRRTEDILLKEQRRYQNTLKQVSAGMTRIRDLKRLLNLIARIVTRSVKISPVGIYLQNPESDGEYHLQARRDKAQTQLPLKLHKDDPIIAWIALYKRPLLREEAKQPEEEQMRILRTHVIIPCFLQERIIGFFALGEKAFGAIYTPEDLNVFQILAAQSALAIENARFFEEAKLMQEQIAQAEKMATVGTMADGLSHQINNRFHALSIIAADTIDTIKLLDTSQCSPEMQEALGQIRHALDRIKENVIQGGEVVKGILKYTRKGEEGFERLTIDQILDGTLEMVQYKVKLQEIDIIRNYPKDIPRIKANQTHLQEVFFNFIDNAYDAIVERRNLLQEENYRGKITVSAHPKGTMLEITVSDNGIGVKEASLRKLFTPFFTTKVSSRRGTGLGLYVIKKLIEEFHQGKIRIESEYKKYTSFIIELPIARE